MYIVLMLITIGYTVLYGNYLGGCLAASLFLMFIISIIFTKSKCKEEMVLFQKNQEEIIVGNDLLVFGKLEQQEFSSGFEIKIKYEIEYKMQNETKKNVIKMFVSKKEDRFIALQETMNRTDFVQVRIKKVWIHDYTGTIWIPCKSEGIFSFMVQPKIYSLLRMGESISDFQEQQWASYEIKEYQKGDKLSRIHWKLLASKRTLFIKNIATEDDESVHVLFQQPEDAKIMETFYTVLYSVCGFFIENKIQLLLLCDGNKCKIQSFEDINQMLCALFLNDYGEAKYEDEYDYKILAQDDEVIVEGLDVKNEIGCNKLDDISDMKL